MLRITLLVLLVFAPGVASNFGHAETSSLSATVKTTPCPPNWFYSLELDNCYYISTNYTSFPSAVNACSEIYHAELVSVYSKFEYDVISAHLEQQNFVDTFPAWIGLQNVCFHSSCYYWLDESVANFTRWVNETEPSNTDRNTCFGWLKTKANDGWIVIDCQNPLPFICKRQGGDNDVVVNGTSGRITSPKYPVPYDPSVTSFYYITVPSDYVVDLTFSFLAIDVDSYISIYDGFNATAKLLENITSTNRQSKTESTSNTIMVKFVASGTSGGNYFGWSANFKAVVPILLSGAMTSPNYPLNYGNNEYINRTVRVPESFGIWFTLWDICVKPGDYLKIMDMENIRGWVYNVCDTSTQRLWFPENKAVITWSTDDQNTSSGFNLTWIAFPL